MKTDELYNKIVELAEFEGLLEGKEKFKQIILVHDKELLDELDMKEIKFHCSSDYTAGYNGCVGAVKQKIAEMKGENEK